MAFSLPSWRHLMAGWEARPEAMLIRPRQHLIFVGLTVERVIVGGCDLLLAGSMYLLFLFLQGAAPAHQHWWTPKSALSAAFVTAVMVIVRAGLDLVSTRSVVSQIHDLYTDLLLRLTQGYNQLQWARFAQRNRSDLLSHAMSTAREAVNFYHLAVEIAASAIVVLLMTGALIDQSPSAACVLGLSLALFYGLHRFLLRSRLQQAGADRESSLRVLQLTLTDMFASAREIRSYGVAGFVEDRIRGQAGVVGDSYRKVAFLPHLARVVADHGVVLIFLCAVIAMQMRHGDSRQLLSLLVFYFVLCRRLLPMISQLSFLAGQMENSYKSVLTVCKELDDCARHRSVKTLIYPPRKGLILELERISFSYCDGPKVLDDVNLSLRHGETVVLCGESGVGKSSLLNVIAGLLQPDSGTVRVQRGSLAYVPQEVVLLDDSIRNNLLFGLTGITDRELMRALAVACLEEFVAAAPHGLDTCVGDNGVLLSGGQRQRIGLARGVLRNASLLLLDEATSALDEWNETRVLNNLRASGIAVLLVTHRAQRKRSGQRLLRLESGHLIEDAEGAVVPQDAEGYAISLVP